MEWCEQQHIALCSTLIALSFRASLPILCDPHLVPFLCRFPGHSFIQSKLTNSADQHLPEALAAFQKPT